VERDEVDWLLDDGGEGKQQLFSLFLEA